MSFVVLVVKKKNTLTHKNNSNKRNMYESIFSNLNCKKGESTQSTISEQCSPYLNTHINVERLQTYYLILGSFSDF